MPDKQTKSWQRFLPLFGLVGAMAAVYHFGLLRFFSFTYIVEHLGALTQFVSNHFIEAILAYIVLYGVITALSLPIGSLLTVVGGLLFGGIFGTVGTVVGATIGASAIFLIAKTSLGDRLLDKAGSTIQKMKRGFQEDSFNYLLFLRLVPAFPFWLVNLAPALLGMAFVPYVVGTFLGIIPATAAFSFIGAGLGSTIEAQKTIYEKCLATAQDTSSCTVSLDLGALVTKELLVALVLLAFVALIPVFFKKLKNRKIGSVHE